MKTMAKYHVLHSKANTLRHKEGRLLFPYLFLLFQGIV